MENYSQNYTCLFGGGAIRGAAYIGTLKALEELNINPDNIGGSSVGSIVATLWAVGYNANEIKKIFYEVNFELFKDLHFGIGPRFAISKGEVFLDWIRNLIEKKFYNKDYKKGKNKAVTFNDIEKNLTIITTDLSNFECNEFSKIETPDYEIATAVRISCTMPGLMKPIIYNDKVLVDGDLQKSIPMWKLSKNLSSTKDRIIEFRLEGEAIKPEKKRNAITYVNTIYSCVTSIGTEYLADLYGNKDKFEYITINTGDVIIVDFNCSKDTREKLINGGYKQTIEYFTKKLPHKKEKLLNNYYLLDNHLKKINKYIIKNKILKTKNIIGELFIDLCDQTDVIDTEILNEIKDFNKTFNNNIKYPALFGKAKLKNADEVISKLLIATTHISNKIYELERYINKYPI